MLGVLGVGTDLVEVERLRTALGRTAGLRERLFTQEEWDYAARHRDPLPHLAARFAAKEAVMKALGAGIDSIAFADIAVQRSDGGQPSVLLTGSAARVAQDAGVRSWKVSLTHTDSIAQAVAIALGAPSSGGPS